LDRVSLLLYRQSRFEPGRKHEFADALKDLRLGVNMIETQLIGPTLSKPAQDALAAMFASLSVHFRALARGRVAQLGDDLLQKIDIAISEATACAATTQAYIVAIVGMRQTLYPNAPPYLPGQMEQTNAMPVGSGEAPALHDGSLS
jgi:hypothetical protein